MKRERRKLTFDRREGPRVGDWGRVLAGAAPIGGLARVLDVDKSDGAVLVEFLESDEELHDGNVGPVRGKNHHCWWINREHITPIIEQASILRDGREMLALVGGAVGKATCCEGEEFDELTGAIIALARAYGVNPTAAAMKVLEVLSAVKKEKKKLRIRFRHGDHSLDFGSVGDATPFKDAWGVPLFVGDEVVVKSKLSEVATRSWVVCTEEDGPFVMGIRSGCDPATGKIQKDWQIERKTTYKERTVGESDFNSVLFIVEDGEPKPESKADARNKKEVRLQ